MKCFGLAVLLSCNSRENTVKEVRLISGPFEIFREATTSSPVMGWFYSSENAKPNCWFQVKYKGKLVQIPVFEPDTNRSMKEEQPQEYFSEALILKDALRPAVLVGTQQMYLLTAENGQPKITPLQKRNGDFTTYQWLDSNNGQPGSKPLDLLNADADSAQFLSGGRYLMVNSSVVLDVQTLEIYPFDFSSSEMLKQIDQFKVDKSDVVAFSPLQSQIVFVGSRFNPNKRFLIQYALVVLDFKKNTAYAMPFDCTDTRFFSIADATPTWLNTYFEWQTDQSGHEMIVPRQLAQRPNWQGHWIFDDVLNEIQEYRLVPVQDSMLPVFLDFIKKQIPISAETNSKRKHYVAGSKNAPTEACFLTTTTLTTENGTIYIYLNPIEHTITLYGDKTGVKKIGQDFDRAMQEGRFQAYFGRFE